MLSDLAIAHFVAVLAAVIEVALAQIIFLSVTHDPSSGTCATPKPASAALSI
jgi:hypothetical protein